MKLPRHRKVPSGSNLLVDTLPTTQLRRSWLKISLGLSVLAMIILISIPRAPPPVMIYLSPLSQELGKRVDFIQSTEIEIHPKLSADNTHFLWLNNSNRYQYDYTQTLQPSGSCKNLHFLVIVTSAVDNVELRKAIRESWGNEIPTAVGPGSGKVIFLLGNGQNKSAEARIRNEAARYGDILQFSFNDTYRNATIKSVMMLKWASECRPKYLIKADDDMMLNVQQLRRRIETLEAMSVPFIAGHAHFETKPIRDSTNKWHVSEEEYPDETFPDYVSGSLYVITGTIISRLYEEALTTPPVSMEDVFITGSLATRIGIPRIGLQGISTWAPVDACDFHNYIGSHYSTPEYLRAYATALRSTQRHCSKVLVLFQICRCTPFVSAISA